MNWAAALHYTIVFLFALLLAGFQTSFWFHVFGGITPPLLWLVVFTYIALYRNGMSAVFQLMFLAIMLAAFSSIGLKVFYLGLLIYFVVIYLTKSRIFWSGPGYFLMICSMGSIAYHVIFYLLSMTVESTRAEPMVLERITQILLTPAFAFPVYWILNSVDGMFIRREIKTDFGGSTYE
jgi:hypothetical protein